MPDIPTQRTALDPPATQFERIDHDYVHNTDDWFHRAMYAAAILFGCALGACMDSGLNYLALGMMGLSVSAMLFAWAFRD